jgi:6-phosphogluconolactonase
MTTTTDPLAMIPASRRHALHWHSCEDSRQLAESLADAVADQLRSALAERGRASLALSGGSTPKRFMQELARRPLDWSAVTVTLVDERWVPSENPRANAGLVRTHLLHGPAAQATFVPLYAPTPTPEAGIDRVRARIDALPLPLDVVVLGMGEDGHTASFFPGGDHLDEALDPNARTRVLPMRAPGAGEPRITLSLPLLAGARARYLLIEGDAKRRVLIEAIQGANRPIGAVLEAAPGVDAYWCP